MSVHGKTIQSNQIKYVPSRDGFLDKDDMAYVDKVISRKKNLSFLPSTVDEANRQDEKYAKAKYKIILHGILEDGRRATVIVDGIVPYCYVRLDSGSPKKEADTIFAMLSEDDDTTPTEFSIEKHKPFMGFQEHKSPFMRIAFMKSKTRENAIKRMTEGEYRNKTYSDDKRSYYRMVCRDYEISFAQWLNLKRFAKCAVDDYTELTFRVNIKHLENRADWMDFPRLKRDRTMTMCWDIETYSDDNEVPLPKNSRHSMFMIGITFQWHHDKESFLRVCLVNGKCAPRDDRLTVECKSEEDLILAFGKIHKKMRPSMVMGFNDGDYDWPWIIQRGIKYPGCLSRLATDMSIVRPWNQYTDEQVYKRMCRTEKVKVEADSYADGVSLSTPGCINVDVRTLFRQLYPTAEKTSLAWFLSKNKLGGKEDMPYHEMFEIRREYLRIQAKKKILCKVFPEVVVDDVIRHEEEKNAADMDRVASYCVVDAFRCHELFRIRNIMLDKRELASLSYTSLFDAFYRANGSKVRNLVIGRGQKRGLLFTNLSQPIKEDGKYPGAYVFPPRKGMNVSKLTMEERIQKAKKHKGSAVIVDGCDQEWLEVTDNTIALVHRIIEENGAVITPDNLDKITKKLGVKLQGCVRDFLEERIGRPITGLDFSSLYPSIMMCYNLSPEYIILRRKEAEEAAKKHTLHKIKFEYNGRNVIGWAVRHDGKLDGPDCKFGIFPSVLKELFDTRKSLKKQMHVYEARKEIIDNMPAEEFKAVADEYDEVCFMFNLLDSKQKALKVFMNTFYGETGNKISPFFLLQIAGGITSAGQYNIKSAQRLVEKYGCVVHYGDTDSIYLSIPAHLFYLLDIAYYTGKMSKLDYWSSMVNLTFEKIKPINEDVNAWFIQDNGTNFLRMAFEEVLYPSTFLAKKKYYGGEHKSIANFDRMNMFIRGLEVKKRGISGFLRKACESIMWDSINPNNLYTLIELVMLKVDDVYKAEWDFEDFVKTAVYKPNKENVAVKTFARRMIDSGIGIKAHERFRFVMVRKFPNKYDSRGRTTKLSVGDRMEFAEVAKKKNMPIDKDYYVTGGLVGQLARLIVYHENFQHDPVDNSEEAQKAADKKTYDDSVKFTKKYCEKHFMTYAPKNKAYQAIFRESNKIIKRTLATRASADVVHVMTSNYDLDNLIVWLCEMAEKAAIKDIGKNFGKDYVEKRLKKAQDKMTELSRLSSKYYSGDDPSIERREKQFAATYRELVREIESESESMKMLFKGHEMLVNKVSDVFKRNMNIDNLYNESGAVMPAPAEIPGFSSTLESDDLEKTAEEQLGKLSSKKFNHAISVMEEILDKLKDAYTQVHKVRMITDRLKYERNKKNGIYSMPDRKNVVSQMVEESMRDP